MHSILIHNSQKTGNNPNSTKGEKIKNHNLFIQWNTTSAMSRDRQLMHDTPTNLKIIVLSE